MVNSLYMNLVMIASVMFMDVVIRGMGHPLEICWQFVVRVFIVQF